MNPLSVLGQLWLPPQGQTPHALAQQLGITPVLADILAQRLPTDDAAAYLDFLSPSLQSLPSPTQLQGMAAAVRRIIQAIEQHEKIAVLGDYDVDGACASALLLRYLRFFEITPVLYVPDRLTEGYGPNERAIETFIQQGVNLMITVDCGSTAHAPLAKAQAAGIDVIITDHHQAPPPLPDCFCCVNPNRWDEDVPDLQVLCGAGVVFYVLMAVNQALKGQRETPDIRWLLDLVALATVADLVPVTGVNRVLVRRGLEVLNQRQNIGLAGILADIEGAQTVQQTVTTQTLGYQVGPRLNAAGRLADSTLGARLLATEDAQLVADIVPRLSKLNQERKRLQEAVLEEALAQATLQQDEPLIFVSGAGWHPGVIGIVAGKLKEQFYRPSFVLAVGEDGTATGSGRSIPGVDLGQCLHQVRDLLLRGGGHAMAGGLTVAQERMAEVQAALAAAVKAQTDVVPDIFTPRLHVAGQVMPATLTPEFLDELTRLAPYGMGHREPIFALQQTVIQDVRPVGDGTHLKLGLQGPDGQRVGGIAFGAMQTALGPCLMQHKGQRLVLAGQVKANTWQGRTRVDFEVLDAHTAYAADFTS